VTIALGSVTIRHERRVRLAFTDMLLASAFVPALYTVTSVDGLATAPTVMKALAVGNSPNVVELQLGGDLVQGALYQFSAPGVPGVSGVTPSPSLELARWGLQRATAAATNSGPVAELEATLFGLDLAWTGSDFAETTGGDLATASGLAVVQTDLTNRLLANGLPWDATYGLQAREQVDGAPNALGSLQGRAVAQLLQDNRVASATATVDISDPSTPTILATAQLVGAAIARGGGALELQTEIG
jgi:hypothetical protein